MTRFARSGDANKKKPHESTEWKDMFQGTSKNEKQNKKQSSESDGQHGEGSKAKSVKNKKFQKLKGVDKDNHNDSKNANPWQQSSNSGKKGNQRDMRNKFFKDKTKKWEDPQSFTKTVCYNCRGFGHKMDRCPKATKKSKHVTGICFKCGSTEHNSSSCKAKIAPGEYPFAKCFICGEMGHITKQCPDNPRGLYPNGGCCNECGSVEHLRRDCPDLQRKEGIESMTVEKLTDTQSADAEVATTSQPPRKKKKGGGKVVKF